MSQIKSPLISIIIVNYNNAKFLKKSLNSAINQTYKFKEIIVVDDISNDRSVEILKSYKSKIKYFVNKKKLNMDHIIKLIVIIKVFKNLKENIFFF